MKGAPSQDMMEAWHAAGRALQALNKLADGVAVVQLHPSDPVDLSKLVVEMEEGGGQLIYYDSDRPTDHEIVQHVRGTVYSGKVEKLIERRGA